MIVIVIVIGIGILEMKFLNNFAHGTYHGLFFMKKIFPKNKNDLKILFLL